MNPQTRKNSEDQRDLLQVKIAELGARLNESGHPKLERDRDHAQLLQSINQHTRLVRDLARQPLIVGAGR
ncbi:MAG: hypothetical protein H0W78_16885 [Planctomycetes bacterium]|nr:hypothetical protein [Planctomycetota bacterium]